MRIIRPASDSRWGHRRRRGDRGETASCGGYLRSSRDRTRRPGFLPCRWKLRRRFGRMDRRRRSFPRIRDRDRRWRVCLQSRRGWQRRRIHRWRWHGRAGWFSRRRAARRRTPPFRGDANRCWWDKKSLARRPARLRANLPDTTDPSRSARRFCRIACGRIGVQICWDQWYPEGSRVTALGGAQVIFYPTSIGWHPHEKEEFGAAQLDAWKTIQRAHAIANGVYVAVANRVGFEGKPANGDPGLEFWGNSFVADPFGQIVAEASNDKEEILVVECDPAKSEDTRRNWPFLRDRRVDAYGPILNRWLGE